jgi:hypothetical protein
MGESMVPGETLFTLIPSRAQSMAMARAREMSAPLVAEYAARPGKPLMPVTEAIRMIDPPPARRMSGTTSRPVK